MKKISLIIFCCCLIASCSTSPKVDNYILYSYQENEIKAVDAESPKVFLKPLIFPAYLDRPQMVVRKNDVKLEIQEFKRWAEPLKSSFLRAFKQGMHNQGVSLTSKKQFRKESFDYLLSVEVIHFEVNMQQKADLTAKWVLLNSDNNQVITSGMEKLEVAIIGEDFSAKISSQSQAVELLSARLAEKIYYEKSQTKESVK